MEKPWPNSFYAWWVAIVMVLCFTVAYIDRQILSLLVAPIQQDLNISDTQFSLLQGISFALFYTLVGIPLGRLADAWNRRNIIVVCIITWTIMTALCGLAASFLWLFLARIGVGIGEGGYPPSASSILSDYFPPDKLTLPLGLIFAGSYIGGGIAFVGGGMLLEWIEASGITSLPFVGNVQPWQLTFIIVALPGFLLLPLIATVREPDRRGKLVYEENSKSDQSLPIKKVISFIWEHRACYLRLMAGVSLFGIYGVAATVWAPAYFIRSYGWTEGEFGLRFGGVFFICGIAGTFAAWAIELFFKKLGYPEAKLLTIIFAVVITLPIGAIATLVKDPDIGLILYGLVIFLFSIVPAIAPSVIMVITPNQMRGQVGAVYGFLISILAFGLGPTLVALVTDYIFGSPAAIGSSLALVALLMCIASLTLLIPGIKYYKESLIEAEAWKNSVE